MHSTDPFKLMVMFRLGSIDAKLTTLLQSKTCSSQTDTDTRKLKKLRQVIGLIVDLYKATRLVPWGLIALGIVTAWKYALPHLQGWWQWLVR